MIVFLRVLKNLFVLSGRFVIKDIPIFISSLFVNSLDVLDIGSRRHHVDLVVILATILNQQWCCVTLCPSLLNKHPVWNFRKGFIVTKVNSNMAEKSSKIRCCQWINVMPVWTFDIGQDL